MQFEVVVKRKMTFPPVLVLDWLIHRAEKEAKIEQFYLHVLAIETSHEKAELD